MTSTLILAYFDTIDSIMKRPLKRTIILYYSMLIDGFEKGPLKYIYMHARFGQEALPGMTLHAQDMCFLDSTTAQDERLRSLSRQRFCAFQKLSLYQSVLRCRDSVVYPVWTRPALQAPSKDRLLTPLAK